MRLILALAITGVLLIGNELSARRYHPEGELSRKFIHITVGSIVAFWPFWLTWSEIEWLSVAFLVVVAISKKYRVFQAIHSVRRPTLGEFFFAISVGSIALMTHNKWIYAAALLQMSLADGLAAVFGVRYGRRRRYSIFGHGKSLVGTLTFLVASLLILIGYSSMSHANLAVSSLIGISALATVIENLAIAGLDNLMVPLFVAVLLRALT